MVEGASRARRRRTAGRVIALPGSLAPSVVRALGDDAGPLRAQPRRLDTQDPPEARRPTPGTEEGPRPARQEGPEDHARKIGPGANGGPAAGAAGRNPRTRP